MDGGLSQTYECLSIRNQIYWLVCLIDYPIYKATVAACFVLQAVVLT